MSLYIVATPIGNLEDITYRAIKVLNEVDFIIAEDTRETSKLLKKYNINKKMTSYRDQNHDKVIEDLLVLLRQGYNIALVSDAGTPCISDPGYKLVRDAVKNEIEVISIPGPSAVISALSISGLPTDKFVFLGFLPKSDKERNDLLKEYKNFKATIVLYESPNRIEKLLDNIEQVWDNKEFVVLANDLTKKFERVYRGDVLSIRKEIEKKKIQGEFVVLINNH